MSYLAVKTVRPSVQSVERAVRKQARKNSLMALGEMGLGECGMMVGCGLWCVGGWGR
jgi:hypothetical protein